MRIIFRSVLVISLILMFGGISAASSEELTSAEIKNGRYFIPSLLGDPDQGEWVQLKDGEYRRDDQNNPLEVKIVALAIGYLSNNKAKDGAVIYGFSTGGTGFFTQLCAVINDRGVLKNSNLIDLEDRIKIDSLRIKSKEIIVDMLAHRPNDPAPFPTMKKTVRYGLVGDKLMELDRRSK